MADRPDVKCKGCGEATWLPWGYCHICTGKTLEAQRKENKALSSNGQDARLSILKPGFDSP